MARALERVADAEELILLGEGAGHIFAVDRLVQEGAGGGEADGARAHAFLHDGGHLRDVLGAGFLVLCPALAHHIAAHGPVRHLGGNVHGVGAAVERVEIAGEAFPFPLQTLGHGSAGNILHAFHQADQPFALFRGCGRKADAAIAHDGCGDAMPGGGRQRAVPGGLGVIMGVDVDPAGRHQRALRINLAGCRACDLAHFGDPVILDGDVAGEGRLARAVGNGAAADDEIVGHVVYSLKRRPGHQSGPGHLGGD